MGLTVKNENSLGEKMFINKLSSGPKCYIIPKYGFSQKQAVISFGYGSADISFTYMGKGYNSPKGTAHFLEHKMFQKKDKDYFTEFINNGAMSNAFTDATKTAYYFSCRDNFYENFELLLKMVSEKYFEEESVEKEKGIIGQEIAMYNDDPNWIVYFNMLGKLYKENPIRYGIAGTGKSIEAINVNVLETAYDAFYTSENMSVVVCGDVDCQKVADMIEKFAKDIKSEAIKKRPEEPSGIGGNFVRKRMGLSVPVFNLGFKHFSKEHDIKQIYGYKMLLDIIAGESSAANEKAMARGLISEPMGMQYLWGSGVSLSIIMGRSCDPRRLGNGIIKEIGALKNNGIPMEQFKRIKKKHVGRFIRGFNSVDAICMAQTELCGLNSDLFDGYNAIKYMEKDYLETLLSSFDNERAVLSVVE